jgi:plasmid stabilization system protein ParE
MVFRVRWTPEALEDLLRLQDLLIESALAREGDLQRVERAMRAIQQGIAFLQTSPFSCRKADQGPFLRELIIPFGHTGYVALFDITDASNVVIVAVRHQRESDYH